MSKRVFLDTNILINADDADAGDKREKAQDLISQALAAMTGVLSTQVLQEYFVVATRKLGLSSESAQRRIELYSKLDVVVLDVERILSAIKLHRLNALSFRDALIVQAAIASGCGSLLSEDMQHGQRFEGVELVNPFR